MFEDDSKIYYFTDGSISKVYNYNGILIDIAGAASFIKIKRNCTLLDNSLVYSYVDINYLECLAIHNSLLNISTDNNDREYIIFTDSDASYDNLKNLAMLDEGNSLSTYYPNTVFKHEVYNTYLVLKQLLYENYTIDIFCCKGRSNPEYQLMYFKKRGIQINLSDARFICHGNMIADEAVKSISKDKQLLNKYIPTITPCNWGIRIL